MFEWISRWLFPRPKSKYTKPIVAYGTWEPMPLTPEQRMDVFLATNDYRDRPDYRVIPNED